VRERAVANFCTTLVPGEQKEIDKINDKYGFLLRSLEAAFHAADDTDRSVAGADYEFPGRLKHKTGDTLAESLLLRADKLECVGDHVDSQDVASCRTTVEVLVIRRHLDKHMIIFIHQNGTNT